jgi:hypothetical protein
MTTATRNTFYCCLLTGLLGGCQSAMEPTAHPGLDVRGSYEVSWWILYRHGDSTAAAAACEGTLVIDRQDSGSFSGTASVAAGGKWPCIEAVVSIDGALKRLPSNGPIGQDPGWAVYPTVGVDPVFGGCTLAEPSPAPGQDPARQGSGRIGPTGLIDVEWFSDAYDCGGTPYRLQASLNGARVTP